MSIIKLAPSMLCADFTQLGDQVRQLEAAGADILHFDIMDNHFVPNLTFGPLLIRHLRPLTKLPMEAHFMVTEPTDIIDEAAKAGADMITVHVEACLHLQRTLAYVKSQQVQVGVALNPATPLDMVQYVLDDVDYILLMSVNPGFSGQKFVPAVKQKAKDLSRLIAASGKDIEIQMDGNVVPANLGELAQTGVRAFVMGSGLFKDYDNIAAGLAAYRQAADEFEKTLK